MTSLNEALWSLLANRGALYEGDVFSILSRSEYVVRAFEYGLADGAVCCNAQFSVNQSYADRFWSVYQKELVSSQFASPPELILFDVKSRMSQNPAESIYITTESQLRYVAFYLCICAADPSFIELIPNFRQNRQAVEDLSDPDFVLDSDKEDRSIGVNYSWITRLPSQCYSLDPAGTPYRMPIGFLPEAIQRVRRCVLEGIKYENPWTEVSFPDWSPVAAKSMKLLVSSESTDHHTSYKAVMNVYRSMVAKGMTVPKMDFIGLQPRLADFKLVYRDSCGRIKQALVQHKIDGKDRARSSRLTKVAVCRGNGEKCRYYFTDLDRFDFLFYEFTFSARPNPEPSIEFFFIPESVIPDAFYETQETEMSFDIPEFQDYRIKMDDERLWVDKMLAIAAEHLKPGTTRYRARPSRPGSLQMQPKPTSAVPVVVSSGLLRPPRKAPIEGEQKKSPVRLYYEIKQQGHNRFWNNVMAQCARMMSGLLVVLSHNHPAGDFLYCRYVWSKQDRDRYFEYGKPPKYAHDLPPNTPVVPIYYYIRFHECSSIGSCPSSADFRRMNSYTPNRILFLDLWGPDTTKQQVCPIVAIPTDDIAPTAAQTKLYLRNLGEDRRDEFPERAPSYTALVCTGKLAAEYTVNGRGPLLLEGNSYAPVWQLLDRFSRLETFSHPEDILRDPKSYRVPLSSINQRLTDENGL